MDYGFKAVVSPKFGDIFRNNATKSGLVPVVVPEDFGAELMEAAAEHPFLEVIVDVENRTVSAPAVGLSTTFPHGRLYAAPPAGGPGRYWAHLAQ